MDEKPKVTEKKIGNTTYIVSSYGSEIPRAVIKNKLKKLLRGRQLVRIEKTKKTVEICD